MQWSFLLSCVAGEVGRKSAGLGACGIVEGGQGFVTETCRVHKYRERCVLGAGERLNVLQLSFFVE